MFISSNIVDLVSEISQCLKENKNTVAVSENCCGGLISSYLVSVSGASKFFLGGTTTYALKSRLVLSGWSKQDIQEYTGPSEEVALRLARNLKFELGATYTLAETGWTGPHAECPYGECFLACCGPNGNKTVRIVTESGDRIENMESFAEKALCFLLAVIKNEPDFKPEEA